MTDRREVAPDNTALRVALWRALHVEVDAPPDMSPFTRPFRASIVARARFVEDLVAERAAQGVGQYVILGAGLDTFAQRRPELGAGMVVFEIDAPGLCRQKRWPSAAQ